MKGHNLWFLTGEKISHNYTPYLEHPLVSPGNFANVELNVVTRCHSKPSVFLIVIVINLVNQSPKAELCFTNISKCRVTDKVSFEDNSGTSFLFSQVNTYCHPLIRAISMRWL